MKCMRCGTKIQTTDVFCENCLADMDKHPVDPDTPINLPRREKHIPVKRSKKRTPKPEEQLRKLRRLVIWLMAIILVLAITLTGAIYLLVSQQHDNTHLLPGQNYGTVADET